MSQVPKFINECDVVSIFPMDVECVVSHPSSLDVANGSASLNVIGGTPPYNITWENGDKGFVITNLSVGEYNATVKDYYGDFVVQTTCVLTGETDCSFSVSVSKFLPTPTPTTTPTPTVTPTSEVTPTPTVTPTSEVTPTPTATPIPDTYSYIVTEAQPGDGQACTLVNSCQLTKTVWSQCSTIATNCFWSNSQSGGETETDPVINGYYGANINGSAGYVQVTNGFITDLQFCTDPNINCN